MNFNSKTNVIKLLASLALINSLQAQAAQQADMATDLPREVIINGVEFVLIPAGHYYKAGGLPQPGAPFTFRKEYSEGNVRQWLDSFYIAKYEARARDLVRFLNANDSSSFNYPTTEENCSVARDGRGSFIQRQAGDNMPATHMSWNLASAWSSWMGFRLPTEAEWEKAARGDDQRLYPWGNAYPDDTYAGFGTTSLCFTWPVDAFKKGVSPYGVYNMAGNVREFVNDWYSMERDAALQDGMPEPNPASKDEATTKFYESVGAEVGPWKLLKGGRWASTEEQIRIGSRIHYLADDTFRCNGTRFAIDVEQVKKHLQNGSAEIIQL